MALLAIRRRCNRLVMEGRSFASVAGLAIVILAQQSASMAIGAGQSGISNPHHIMMLGFCRTGSARISPESVVMAGGTALWHQRVVATGAIGYCAAAENHVVVLVHRRPGTPEAGVVAEETAGIGVTDNVRDIRTGTMAEATGNV